MPDIKSCLACSSLQAPAPEGPFVDVGALPDVLLVDDDEEDEDEEVSSVAEGVVAVVVDSEVAELDEVDVEEVLGSEVVEEPEIVNPAKSIGPAVHTCDSFLSCK